MHNEKAHHSKCIVENVRLFPRPWVRDTILTLPWTLETYEPPLPLSVLLIQAGQGSSTLVVGVTSPTILSTSLGKTGENLSHERGQDAELHMARFCNLIITV